MIFVRKIGGIDLDEGLTLIKQPVLQPNLQPNIVCKQNVFQSLCQLPLTALFTKESLALWIVYIKFRLQINIFDPRINSGSTVQGELAASAVWGVVLQFSTDDGFTAESYFNQPSRCSLNAHTTLPCMSCPVGTRRASFAICSACYFIAENKIKAFAYSISQSATLTALFTKESLSCDLFGLLIYIGKVV